MKIIESEIIELRGANYNLFRLNLLAVTQYIQKSNALFRSRNKLEMELMSTFLLACMFKKGGHDIAGLGFPCVKEKINGVFKLDGFRLDDHVIECSDFDTVIFRKVGKIREHMKIQVVRFVHQENPNTDSFFEFLKTKKLNKYKRDNSLYLLINIQDAIQLDYVRLNEMLKKTNVPFASIFAIGHQGSKKSLEYVGIKIYPEAKDTIKIDFHASPPG